MQLSSGGLGDPTLTESLQTATSRASITSKHEVELERMLEQVLCPSIHVFPRLTVDSPTRENAATYQSPQQHPSNAHQSTLHPSAYSSHYPYCSWYSYSHAASAAPPTQPSRLAPTLSVCPVACAYSSSCGTCTLCSCVRWDIIRLSRRTSPGRSCRRDRG